ncbi:beta-ketoacyl-ACP reductase [Streptomyces spiralis]|uniref:Beta-ketoacyl-ACP reductase n=1 Tax=Streptomyces spiralis TaxID=66376 RepID=A0A919E4W7_9ACTN|nr:SDR family oxidoreductase [Streptomyces spiralis]GHF13309.1 beta-ketoacyl-ACP reductase [Streptomyces spiralis]
MSLYGKVALVTGAGRGIGRALATGLAESGVRVGCVARSQDELSRTVQLVASRGGSALAVNADLGDPRTVPDIVHRVTAELGSPDILINNAATVEPLGHSTDMTPDTWNAAFRLNVITPAALSAALLPRMTAAGWGRIVNVSSGIVARPETMIGGNAYAATKAALEAHTLNLATELTGTGVTVNVYRPGSVDTAMQALIRRTGGGRLDAATYTRFVRSHEEGKLISAEDSALSLIARLTDDATGQVWDVHDSR